MSRQPWQWIGVALLSTMAQAQTQIPAGWRQEQQKVECQLTAQIPETYHEFFSARFNRLQKQYDVSGNLRVIHFERTVFDGYQDLYFYYSELRKLQEIEHRYEGWKFDDYIWKFDGGGKILNTQHKNEIIKGNVESISNGDVKGILPKYYRLHPNKEWYQKIICGFKTWEKW